MESKQLLENLSQASSEILPIQVEVIIQDCFFSDPGAEKLQGGNNNPNSPISPKTWEVWLSHWLRVLNLDLSPIQAYELSLRLTNNSEIQALNAQYRQKDQPTDVLAFAALEVDSPRLGAIDEPLYLGDMIISVETAQVQAQGHTLEQELAWLAAHALLHLLGWDHPTEEQLLAMLQKQAWLLQQVGVIPPVY
ncbi:MAG: rRNA maturation RNase YbeY [Leptolyngbyaceae cyanobacterium CSU_1_4]|nr:rRNA maturation RNase YbeY [Leptolyngbyaceae cyanobacterium CSU_1_4]